MGECLMTNCRKSAPSNEAMCAEHRTGGPLDYAAMTLRLKESQEEKTRLTNEIDQHEKAWRDLCDDVINSATFDPDDIEYLIWLIVQFSPSLEETDYPLLSDRSETDSGLCNSGYDVTQDPDAPGRQDMIARQEDSLYDEAVDEALEDGARALITGGGE